MPQNTALPTVEGITGMYNRFSLSGWASDKPIIEAEIPDVHSVVQGKWPWGYEDKWQVGFVDPDIFVGETKILYEGRIVFYMTYHGLMDDVATHVVKRALRRQYTTGVFRAGRGPEEYTYRNFRYYHEVIAEYEHNDDKAIVGFAGREAVHNNDTNECRGWCFTQGGVLIPGVSTAVFKR